MTVSEDANLPDRRSPVDDPNVNVRTDDEDANLMLDSPVACNDETAPQQSISSDDVDCVGGLRLAQHLPRSCKPLFKHPALLRSSQPIFELPHRIQASLLIQRALKFIDNDYHLILRKFFFGQLDRACNPQSLNRTWTCSL